MQSAESVIAFLPLFNASYFSRYTRPLNSVNISHVSRVVIQQN